MLHSSKRSAALPLLAACLTAIFACQEKSITIVDVMTVRVQPDSVSLSVGESARLSAAFLDADGNVLGGRTVQWSSSDASVATVDETGTVTALRPGKATITARSEGIAGNAVLVTTPAPAISVAPAAITFAAVRGEPAPAPRVVRIDNSGTGTLAGLEASIVYGAGPTGWLSVTLDRSTAPATLTATVTGPGLDAGSYAAAIHITSASGASLDLPVQLRVETPAPVIVSSATAVTFSMLEGGLVPQAETIAITNGGGGGLNSLGAAVSYAAGQPTGWLSATLSPSSAPSTLTLTIVNGALPEGAYEATAQIVSPGAANSPVAVRVTLLVGPAPEPPAIALSAAAATFGATAGGADPAGRSIAVTNTGEGSLTGLTATVRYGAGQPADWLTASLSRTTAPADLALRPSVGSLPVGTYTATVEVASHVAPNSPRSIAVTLDVRTPAAEPAITLSATTASFAATAGGANPGVREIAVTNGGDGALTGLATSVTYDNGQPAGWLTAVLSGEEAPATLTLRAATGTLAPGTYRGTVDVRSPVAGNSPRTVAVTLTLRAAPVPDAPSNLKADGGKGRIDVSWRDNSDDETGFILQQAEDADGPWTDIALPANTTSHRVGGLRKGDRLYFRVMACNAAGCSAVSNTDSDRAG